LNGEWTSAFAATTDDKSAMRPFAKSLWTLVHLCIHPLRTCLTAQISSGVESLFNKLRSTLKDSSPEWTGDIECDACTRLSLCAARLERLNDELADETVFRDILAKMHCTLFQVCRPS